MHLKTLKKKMVGPAQPASNYLPYARTGPNPGRPFPRPRTDITRLFYDFVKIMPTSSKITNTTALSLVMWSIKISLNSNFGHHKNIMWLVVSVI